MPAVPLHFPVTPDRIAGVNCYDIIVSEHQATRVTVKCKECGSVVGTVTARILKALEPAIADDFVFHKFNEMDVPRVYTSVSEE